MSTLVRHSPTTIQSRRVQEELVASSDLLNYEQAVTQYQLEALGRVHGIASFEVARTLATTELILAARARIMTPQEQAAYQQLQTDFLKRVSDVTRLSSEKIVRVGIPRASR